MPDPDPARTRRSSPCALRGDEDMLYRAYADRLLRAVRVRVRATDDQIEDACASAWLILLAAQPRRETAFAWLLTVAEREAWRICAADRTQAPVQAFELEGSGALLDPPAEFRDPLAPLHARELLRAVAAALPERQLRLVALQALGYTYAQIVEITGETPRAVDRHMRRAKRGLDPLREPSAA
jgi:DNA-directed RNA polymerase specialized sigma24 family protein